MKHTKTIAIEAFLPSTADKKAEAAETIVNTLEEDTLKFFAQLCIEKGKKLNESIRSNQNVIREQL